MTEFDDYFSTAIYDFSNSLTTSFRQFDIESLQYIEAPEQRWRRNLEKEYLLIPKVKESL
jgi:hypothetical protein